MFTTIDALIFLSFDDDSLTNRNLFIELRDNVFFMFFEFMISTFAHELLSREFVMLLFSAIRINVENDSKDVFDFKFATIFLFFETIIFHSWKSVFDSMNFATTNLKTSRIVCDFSAKYNLILMRRVKSIFFFFFLFRNSRFTQSVYDFHMRRIFCACRWCWDRNRSCDVFARTYRIRQQFCNVYRCDCIFDNWSIVVKCNFW